MDLETFKKIAKQVSDLEKSGMVFNVNIPGERSWEKDCKSAYFEPTFYSVNNFAQLSELQQILGRSIKMKETVNYGTPQNQINIKDPVTSCTKVLGESVLTDRDFMVLRKDHPTVKYFSPNLQHVSQLNAVLISDAPFEKEEDKVTYRYIGNTNMCDMCIPHTHQLYNYLDKGFVYAKINKHNEKDKVIITNEMTPDTYLVMLLVSLQPAYTKQLQNECFINHNQAKLLRIKFEKDLKPEYKTTYDKVKDILLKDYEKAVNSNMIVKVVKGELPIATYNRIKLTKDSANYEGVTLEAPGMLEYLNDKMVFDDRTDIYNIISSYIDAQLADLEASTLPEIAEGETESKLEKEFTINGITLTVARTSNNTRRSINEYYINKEELNEVCFRASCFTDQETYDKFVKSVHTMSLKWHDAIGNGIPVKIHDALTALEYKSATPPTTCPRIKFSKEEDNIYLITGEGEKDRCPIKLNMAIKKIAQLNRRTTNKYSREFGYTPRNAAWARRQLVRVLKECCTFDKKEPILDANGDHIIVDGKKTYNIVKECKLDDEKAAFISKMANEYYDKAIKRSSLFLAEAVKTTNAKSITFNGEDCWYVEGNMHKYAVSKKTNQVYNYERGNYICIVEPGHRVEVGFDATACRLLALKNDSVRVQQISTLRNA